MGEVVVTVYQGIETMYRWKHCIHKNKDIGSVSRFTNCVVFFYIFGFTYFL